MNYRPRDPVRGIVLKLVAAMCMLAFIVTILFYLISLLF